MQKYLVCSLLIGLLPLWTVAQTSDKQKIMAALDQQVTCWNKGDLECFMATYWKSDSLKFMGSRGVTYGWQNTLDNYKKAYPDQESRGQLKFDILNLDPVGEDHYFVIGRFYLTREIGDVKGLFSLIWKKTEDGWVIIADHSSVEN